MTAIEPRRAPGTPTFPRRNADAIVGLLFHLLAVTIVLVGVLLAQAAAQDRTSLLRTACLADYQRLCSSVTPGGGRIKQCMLDHTNELSSDCRSVLLSKVDQ
jgi:hypothetical protein